MCRVILRSRTDPSHPPDLSRRPHSRDPASRASLNPRLATGCSKTKTCANRGMCGLIAAPAPNTAVVTGFNSETEKTTLKVRPLLPSVPSALQPCSQNILAAPHAGKAAHSLVVRSSPPFYSHLDVAMIFPVFLCTREALTTRHSRFGDKKGHVSSYQESQLVYFSVFKFQEWNPRPCPHQQGLYC